MATCAWCGNQYDKTFTLTTTAGETHTFDSFECAIHMLAPVCDNCGVRIVGHGVEANGVIYCCAHCSRQQGVEGLQDDV